jgi:hypothetical protein
VRPAHRPASTIPVGALAQDQPGHFAPLLLGERRPELLDRALSFAVPALLAALVVTGTVVERHDIRLATAQERQTDHVEAGAGGDDASVVADPTLAVEHR